LTGENIKADDTGITSGSVDHITFNDENGKALVTVAGDFEAKEIYKVLATRGAQTAVQFVFDGNDTFTGSDGVDRLWGFDGNDRIDGGKGDDEIHGGHGRDVMTGGAGSDLFIFWPGDGKDVIKDFDASGGGNHQDYIYVPPEDHFTIKADKDGDAMLVFDSGDTLTFEGVAKKQITMDDFYVG
jgi:Ca2+-binding RTX toxin-like protein